MKKLQLLILLFFICSLGFSQTHGIVFKSELERLDNNVNSEYSEAEPKLSPDGKTLYFCRRENPQNFGDGDIWYSELDKNGKWTKAKNAGKPLNNENFNQVISIRSDGNAMFLYGAYDDTDRNLFISYKQNGKWTNPKAVEIENFTKGRCYYVSADFQILIVCYSKGVEGEEDFYVSFPKENGKWTEPKYMGDVLNSPDSEVFPILANDNKTLYFASNKKGGYGSYDVYLSRRLDDTWTSWSEPINMGDKINSTSYDSDFTTDSEGKYAYISSTLGSVNNEFNIFRIELPTDAKPNPVVLVRGKVTNEGKPVSAEVTYSRLKDGKVVGKLNTDSQTGDFQIVLPYGEKYGISANAKGYAAISDYLDLTKNAEYKELTKDIKLIPLAIGSTVRMNNLFFDSGKSELKSESYSEINNLIQLMNDSPSMEIEISGHTDDVGSATDNLKLSEARAKTVAAYLITKGISATRIKSKGYGKMKPIASNKTAEGKEKNRRVEFVILKK